MRLSSLADYAVVMMGAAARHCGGQRTSATELAAETGIPLPTAQKLVSLLTRAGLLKSVRGQGGGIKLARPSAAISLADIIEAIEGPIAMTNCTNHGASARVADYEHGWSSDIEQEYGPKGLSEDTVRFISAKKNEPEWMLDWRLKAYRHWLTMTPPDWAKLNVPPIDYQDAYYWAAPKAKPKLGSLDEVDPEILRIYEKLGIPLEEQKVLAGVEGARKVAVDAVFDSVSVATTFRKELEGGRDLPLDLRGDPRISRAGEEVAGQGRADARQLFRHAELRGL
jgi:Rrf2 family protein